MGAFIKIPFLIVPFTLQTFFVLLSGNLLGARYGALSQALYIMIGLIGLPIFALGGGPGYIVQPTFGYLMAYPLGAFISGILIQLIFQHKKDNLYSKRKFFLTIFAANMLSLLLIFLAGVSYLYINLNFIIGKEIGFINACWSGFIIFIPAAILKVLLASLMTIRIKKYIRI